MYLNIDRASFRVTKIKLKLKAIFSKEPFEILK